jgi:dihydroxyacetone kinase
VSLRWIKSDILTACILAYNDSVVFWKDLNMTSYSFNKTEVVRQAMCGHVALSSRNWALVDKHDILIREDYPTMVEQCSISTMGGAGHESKLAYFVGPGMATVHVSGNIFASPPIDAILTALLLVTEEQRSALLIVLNYSGDKMNAQIAVERARAMGRNVDILVVADDVSIENPEKRRGVAGQFFVLKHVAYLAQQGYSLEEIKSRGEETAQDTMTLSFTTTGASSPSDTSTSKFDPQIGRGIHNEAGKPYIFRTENQAKEAVEEVVNRLLPMIDSNSGYAILINNLGATTPLEMGNITWEILNSKLKDFIQLVVGPASFVSSLDAKGFSISMLPLNAEREKALLNPVSLRTGDKPVTPLAPKLIDTSSMNISPEFSPSMNEENLFILNQGCQALKSSREVLNTLDAYSGDGDCGTTLYRIAAHIADQTSKLPLDNQADLLQAIGYLISSVGGGSIGAILTLLFTRAGLAFETGQNLAAALKKGVEVIMSITGTQVGQRSLIDALWLGICALEDTGNLEAAAIAAREGANLTANTVAKVGRATLVPPENYLGHNDAGAEAVAIVFERLNEALSA